MKPWTLTNKRALVTGGTKGIGKAIVNELLALGAEVLFTGRTVEDVKAREAEWQQQGLKAYGLAGDVTDADHLAAAIQWVESHWGSLEILVNNAGTTIRRPSVDFTTEEYRRVLDINLIAPFEWSRKLYPLLKQSGNAAVINISSVAGSLDAGTGAPYGMSKSGLNQLTRNLAGEWAKEGIRVNTVSPWYTYTPLTENVLAKPEVHDRIVSRTPMRRIAKDEEMAGVVAFLAMDKASYITGQEIKVDGGGSIGLF
ncbi:SDR family oxidoreductase [Chitinophaga agrisoli]|uniref:SDR family oxidoreductase n=1 Tax=Chitinophaga agrisoli TaxID=2607653 RepID=A0A5B2VVC6_9BACT|nr:SDR family oxidoreductase [Chitinophaga agrisoli]KAA2242734.1 SDR family oxidoreductase [Chitinophaga agrisoli]